MNREVIYSCPAYDVVVPVNNSLVNLPDYKAGDEVAIYKGDKRVNKTLYKMGSAVSYALERNDDPIAMYERAKELNHDLYWIFALPVTISANKQERKVYKKLELEKPFLFEGKILTAVSNRFGDITLKEIMTKDAYLETMSAMES